MPDSHKNFAYSTVATAPSPADTGTSLVVQAGGGALFPTVPFNATVWPTGVQPLASNAEIVRVTNIATDTFTITRQQEGSSARSILVGDQIAATITAKTFTDVYAQYGALAEAETWAALQTFNAGLQLAAAQQIKDSGGTGRILLSTATPHVTLTGETRIGSNVGIDCAPSSSPDTKLTISPTLTGVTDWRGISLGPVLTLTGNNAAATAMFGSANIQVPASSSGHSAYGLNFGVTAIPQGAAAAVTRLIACSANPRVFALGIGKALTVTDLKGYEADPLGGLTVLSSATATLTTVYGMQIRGGTVSNALITIPTYYGLHIGDALGTSLGTVNLLEIGGATPYLRVEGKTAPAANLSNVLIAVNNGAVVLRRIEIGAADSGGAGFRTLRAAN